LRRGARKFLGFDNHSLSQPPFHKQLYLVWKSFIWNNNESYWKEWYLNDNRTWISNIICLGLLNLQWAEGKYPYLIRCLFVCRILFTYRTFIAVIKFMKVFNNLWNDILVWRSNWQR
jgi:hypothetical protein